jgi:hypothetical protein
MMPHGFFKRSGLGKKETAAIQATTFASVDTVSDLSFGWVKRAAFLSCNGPTDSVLVEFFCLYFRPGVDVGIFALLL